MEFLSTIIEEPVMLGCTRVIKEPVDIVVTVVNPQAPVHPDAQGFAVESVEFGDFSWTFADR